MELDCAEVVHNLKDAHCASLVHYRMTRHVNDAITDIVGRASRQVSLKIEYSQPSAIAETRRVR